MIHSVAVLGAGVMGAQIAAHVANAGVPVLLLDITAAAAAAGLTRARGFTPDPAFTPATWTRITTAGFDDGLPRLNGIDWTIEAVVERLDEKRSLLARVDTVRRPGSIVSSNTSGIPLATLAEGRSDDFRRHWLGTHFFNPPRYLRLLEIIPTASTDAAVVGAMSRFADRRLGKGIVIAKDTPGFIGNHLGLYSVVRILPKVASGEYSIDEVDAITGQAIGRPKSATFRTLDLAGLDILANVVRQLHERLPDARARDAFVLPAFVEAMLERGLVGEKAGRGFYAREKATDGSSRILTLDPATLEYRESRPPRFPSLQRAATITDPVHRLRTLFSGSDRVAAFLHDTLAPMLVYAARVTRAIADSPDDVDRVMRWGFGWEMGPFELADAIGLREVLDAAAAASPELLEDGVPRLWRDVLDRGRNVVRTGPLPPAGAGLEILRSAKDRTAVIRRNAGASLVDLGDGVLCVEFHGKMNVIGSETVEMLHAALREASRNFAAVVVGNDGPNFSAGADLQLVLLKAQDGSWADIDLMIRSFQQVTLALRYADVPVVVAPAGLTLGGGCELMLHADRVQAAAESYIGLVETGVGLIPAGGGTKEMVARAAEALSPGETNPLPSIQRAFETVAFGKTSTSAADAARLGYLRPIDRSTMNRDRLIADAKALVLRRVADGYQPPPGRPAIPVGGDAVSSALMLGVHLAWRAGRLSDHDALIGRTLAKVMAGGSLPHPTTVTEQQLLDLEREAFLSLLAQPKTHARITHTLATGKPLRN